MGSLTPRREVQVRIADKQACIASANCCGCSSADRYMAALADNDEIGVGDPRRQFLMQFHRWQDIFATAQHQGLAVNAGQEGATVDRVPGA